VTKDMETSRYDITSRCTTLSMIHSLHAFRTSVVRTVCDIKKYLYKYRLSSTPSFAPVKALHMLHLSSIVSLPVCQCVCAHPLISNQRQTLEEQLLEDSRSRWCRVAVPAAPQCFRGMHLRSACRSTLTSHCRG
jgi:hypothetical protein